MFNVILYRPEIPPNTGNIIRLCANTGSTLHLVHPLGFELDDRRLRRAGLDYREWADLREHQSLAQCLKQFRSESIYACTTKGLKDHVSASYSPGDALLFGPESRGLPLSLLRELSPQRLIRIPMKPGSRSLNLSNSVAVVLYEAWRQNNFSGAG